MQFPPHARLPVVTSEETEMSQGRREVGGTLLGLGPALVPALGPAVVPAVGEQYSHPWKSVEILKKS